MSSPGRTLAGFGSGLGVRTNLSDRLAPHGETSPDHEIECDNAAVVRTEHRHRFTEPHRDEMTRAILKDKRGLLNEARSRWHVLEDLCTEVHTLRADAHGAGAGDQLGGLLRTYAAEGADRVLRRGCHRVQCPSTDRQNYERTRWRIRAYPSRVRRRARPSVSTRGGAVSA